MSDDHDPLDDGDLIAYLDGELTDAAKADLERRLQTDDSAQARLEELRVSNDLVRKLFDVDVPRTVSPREEEKIRELVRQHEAAAQSEKVVSFSSYRQRLRSGVIAVSTATGLNTLADGHGWQKIAASLVIGGFLGLTVGPQLALEPEADGFAPAPTNQNYVTRGVENEVLRKEILLRHLEPQLYLINIENNKNYSPGDVIKTSEKYKISLEDFPAGPVEISFDDGLSPKMVIKKYDVKSRSDIINDIAISNIEGKYAIFEVSYLKDNENKYRLFIFGIN